LINLNRYKKILIEYTEKSSKNGVIEDVDPMLSTEVIGISYRKQLVYYLKQSYFLIKVSEISVIMI
jgi:hypothetical protein